jgi:hypothetical protein
LWSGLRFAEISVKSAQTGTASREKPIFYRGRGLRKRPAGQAQVLAGNVSSLELFYEPLFSLSNLLKFFALK